MSSCSAYHFNTFDRSILCAHTRHVWHLPALFIVFLSTPSVFLFACSSLDFDNVKISFVSNGALGQNKRWFVAIYRLNTLSRCTHRLAVTSRFLSPSKRCRWISPRFRMFWQLIVLSFRSFKVRTMQAGRTFPSTSSSQSFLGFRHPSS